MPDLSCAVTSCFYNKTDRCCKENIQVEGADARVMNETSCGSFRPRRGDSFVNMEAGTPEAKTSVHCEAHECVHNDNCNCVADLSLIHIWPGRLLLLASRIRAAGSGMCSGIKSPGSG